MLPPPVVVNVLIRVFASPLSRVVTLEIISRAAVSSTRGVVARIFRPPPPSPPPSAAAATRIGSSASRLTQFPRYRYMTYATLIQVGTVTAFSYLVMTPDVFIEDDYVPDLPDVSIRSSESGSLMMMMTKSLPGYCGFRATGRIGTHATKIRSESLWSLFGYPVANFVVFVAAMGMINGQIERVLS